MPSQNPSQPFLNARYVAIRTAEAKGMTDRLLQAAHDRTPGVRRLLIPILYRFWYRERVKGWELLARIAEDTIRFPGIPDAYAIETFAEFSLATLNGCRGDQQQLARLASIWHAFVERIFATPAHQNARTWIDAEAFGKADLARHAAATDVPAVELQGIASDFFAVERTSQRTVGGTRLP